jgi:hypothetical protein
MIEVLEACVLICKFFFDQKVLNDEAKGLLADLADYGKRLLPSLQSLDTRGLESAALHLSHLWECLQGCQRIYVKYKDGWKVCRFHVTPQQIRDKAKTQEERTRNAWRDLSTHLSIVIHNTMQPSAPQAASAETRIDDTWELDVNSVQIEIQKNGFPKPFWGRARSALWGLERSQVVRNVCC